MMFGLDSCTVLTTDITFSFRTMGLIATILAVQPTGGLKPRGRRFGYNINVGGELEEEGSTWLRA